MDRIKKIRKIWAAAGLMAILICGNASASTDLFSGGIIKQEESGPAQEDSRNIYREDYYGAQLNQAERQIYDTLYEQYYVKRDAGPASLSLQLPGYENMSQEEQKSGISNLFYAAVIAFLTDYQVPLSDGYQWECKSLGDTVDLKCQMEELYPGALGEYEAAREGMKLYKAELDQKITERFGERGKRDRYAVLLTIHDDLIDRITYSYSPDRVNRDEESGDYYYNRIGNTLASVALGQYNRYSVCQGYMAAVKELCDLYQIPCVRVDKRQKPGEKAGHSWAYAELEDGEWYSLDVTLDDLEDGEKKKTSHQYFLTGAATLDAEHIPYIPLREDGGERLAVIPKLAAQAAPDKELHLEQRE